MDKAIEKAVQMEESQVDIITDSKSLLQRLQTLKISNVPKNQAERRILSNLHDNPCKNITIIWCPSHCGVEGNEEADDAANEGSNMYQNVTHTFEAAKASIRRHFRPPIVQHPLAREIYEPEGGINKNNDTMLTREQQACISRIRSGHHPELQYWQHKIGTIENDSCRLCGMAPETTQHIYVECPSMTDQRDEGWTLQILIKDPVKALNFWDTWQARVARC